MNQRWWGVWVALLFAARLLHAATETPLGIVSGPGDGRLLRLGWNVSMTLVAGELLFQGDTITTGDSAVELTHCGSGKRYVLAARSRYVVNGDGVKQGGGMVEGTGSVGVCELPPVGREWSANEYNYGSTMSRDGAEVDFPKEPIAERMRGLSEEQRAVLAGLDKALQEEPNSIVAMVSRASLYRKYGLELDALREFQSIDRKFRIPGLRGFTHGLDTGQRKKAASGPGKTYALLVGISEFLLYPKKDWLAFANADAALMKKFLMSPAGGSVPEGQIRLLMDQEARTANIRTGIRRMLEEAGPNDTVVILLATHGLVNDKDPSEGYILSYDADPQAPRMTAITMGEIQKLLYERLNQVGRALVFVDICRAATLGTFRGNRIDVLTTNLLKSPGQVLGFMASRSDEVSWEGPNWGNGHGAFSYFLLRGMNGEADQNGTPDGNDGVVSVKELINYVVKKVQASTIDNQMPVEIGANIPYRAAVSEVKKKGIDLSDWSPLRLEDVRSRNSRSRGSGGATSHLAAEGRDALDVAIDAGKLLKGEPGSAWELLESGLKNAKDRLRVALENSGQEVLIEYIQGDAAPQKEARFLQGAEWFAAARELLPESLLLESKELFCRGRWLIFKERYPEAIELLERALRLDPKGAYTFNALGIGYLQEGKYEFAIAAFRDAIRLEPHWAYPYHNAALAYAQIGDYEGAIRSYQVAAKMTPAQAYVPYGLGLLYQRLRQWERAEQAYKDSLAIQPAFWQATLGLATLSAQRGKLKQAETLYRKALEASDDKTLVRHNLGILLLRQKGRRDEAIQQWKLNGDFVPSRLLLASALSGDRNEAAVAEYEAILRLQPDFEGARIEAARLLGRMGELDRALRVLDSGGAAKGAQIEEVRGDLYLEAGKRAEAGMAYGRALAASVDVEVQRRLRGKQMKAGRQ